MAQYKILEGENLYIVSVKLYGSVDYVMKLAIDNNIEDITADLSGLVVEYDETIKSEVMQTLVLKTGAEQSKTKTFKGRQGQSIFDICLVTTGDLESIVTLIKGSTMENITDIVNGVTFSYELTNNALKQYADKNKYIYQTGTELVQARYSGFTSAFNQQAYL